MSASICLATSTQGEEVMRYSVLATARVIALWSLALPVVSSHRQGLTWGSVDARTTITAIAGQRGTSGATPLLLHHYRRANG